MAALLCPAAASCRSASFRRRAASPDTPFPSRRHQGGASPVPLASAVAPPPPPPRALAAASYGYGGDLLRPIDTQTIIIAAAVISAVSLSLVLGLKVSAAGISFFLLDCRLLASGCDVLCCLVAGGPGALRPVRWKWYYLRLAASPPLCSCFG
jgi:hypothetical protein